jgi:hypothetical protein
MEKNNDNLLVSLKFTLCFGFFTIAWFSFIEMLLADNLLDVIKNGFSAILYAVFFMYFTPIEIREKKSNGE